MKKITRTSFIFGTTTKPSKSKRGHIYVAPIKRGVQALMLMLMFTVTTMNAQSIDKSYKTYDLGNLTTLNVNLEGNVVYKNTNSSRVSIVKTTKVTHPTKDVIIAKFVANSVAHEEATLRDATTDSFTIATKPGQTGIMVDGVVATVETYYEIYVPKHIKIQVGHEK